MAASLPHTQNGFAQTAAEQQLREQRGEDDGGDPTTLKFDGKVALSREDTGSDPYNRTGRFERLVR